MTRSCRIGVIASHFIQYQAPVWRELAKREGVDVSVYYLSEHGRRPNYDQQFGNTFSWDIPLDEGYTWELLPGAKNSKLNSKCHRWNLSPVKKVYDGVADVFLRSDYDSPGAVAFFYACMTRGVPILYRGETTLLHENKSTAGLKRTVLEPVFSRIVFALAIGQLAREYALSLGVPPERIIPSPYNVDTAYWETAARNMLPMREDLRRTFGLPMDRPVVLFCGKIIEKKRPIELAQAMCLLAKRMPVSLLVAGTGDQMEKMKATISGCGDLPICFAGFVNQSRLPEIYAASDVLCLPSGGAETWGLVVNEAMHFGCIPVVSDRVGCGPDLVEGIGEIHRVGDVEGIASCIMKVIDTIEDRRKCIPDRIAQYSLARAVDGIVEGAMRATNA